MFKEGIKEGARERLQKHARKLLDYIFPVFCVACDKEGDWLCNSCAAKIALEANNTLEIKLAHGLEDQQIKSFFAFFPYSTEHVRKMVHLLKYSGAFDIKTGIEKLLDAVLQGRAGVFPELEDVQIFESPLIESALMVPIPLSPKRMRSRGFNQAEILAQVMAKKIKCAVDVGLLERKNTFKHQAELSRAERLENVKNIFYVNRAVAERVKAERGRLPAVILVDDVITTGATMNSAALALRNAGFEKIYGLALAHEE